MELSGNVTVNYFPNVEELVALSVETIQGMSISDCKKLVDSLAELARIAPKLKALPEITIMELRGSVKFPRRGMFSAKTIEALEKSGIVVNGQVDPLTMEIIILWITHHDRIPAAA